MTVSTTTNKVIRDGDGSQLTFGYSFKIFADGDLDVYVRTDAGSETLQTISTNYTVTGAGNDAGGNVVFVAGQAPSATEKVVIQRKLSLTQSTDYTPNDPFPAESHEEALDRLTFITQQLQEEVDRSIKASVGNTFDDPEFTVPATTRANKIFAFDSDGDLAITQEIGTFQGTDATITTEAYNQRDLVKSTTAAELNNVYICVADSVIGDLLTDTDHFELLVDAVSAATSATNAANDAADAEKLAINPEDSQFTLSDGSTTGYSALHHKEKAIDAQTAAETAKTAAELALDTFDDRMLGAKSSDPTVDNDGDALVTGALYFHTTDGMKVYDGSAWDDVKPTAAEQTNIDTVAGISANVTTVAGANANITTVAGQITPTNNIATVAGIDTEITTVAGDSADIQTVASDSADIRLLADNISTISAKENVGVAVAMAIALG